MSDLHGFDADALNMSMRKFLKRLGVTSQQEIEAAIRAASASGALKSDSVSVKAVVTIESIGLTHMIDGEIDLKDDSAQGGS